LFALLRAHHAAHKKRKKVYQNYFEKNETHQQGRRGLRVAESHAFYEGIGNRVVDSPQETLKYFISAHLSQNEFK
jgi:hypothetical protein